MIETHLRNRVQPLFNTIGTRFAACHISANNITLLALLTGLCAALCIATSHLKAALCLLMLSGLFDMLDGTVARLNGTSHNFGAYCDLVADRMVEAAVIIGFAWVYPEHIFAYLLFFAAVMLHFSTFVAAGALFPNMGAKSMHYDASIVERAEAFMGFFAMLVWPHLIFELLMLLNIIIFVAGITRFKRVMEYVHSTD